MLNKSKECGKYYQVKFGWGGDTRLNLEIDFADMMLVCNNL